MMVQKENAKRIFMLAWAPVIFVLPMSADAFSSRRSTVPAWVVRLSSVERSGVIIVRIYLRPGLW